MWSAAVLEVAAAANPGYDATLEQVRPLLQSGFPWHTPDRPHVDIRSAQAWWDALYPVLARAFEGLGFEPVQAERLAWRVRHVYPDPKRWRLFDDTLSCLRALSERGCLQVILSNHVPELPELVAHLGIGRFISRTFVSAQTGYEKPHPRAFQLVLEAYPLARRAIVVGDSPTADIAGARFIGLPAILVRSDSADARFAARRLTELPSLLDAGLGLDTF